MKKKIGGLLKKLAWLPLGVLAFFASLVIFTQLPGSPYKFYAVVSGSMEPAVKVGDVVFVDKNANYDAGDVITFRRGDKLITHRIVSSNKVLKNDYYEVKGDANNASDPESVVKSDVVGKVVLALPLIGYLAIFARSWLGLLIFLIIPALVFLILEGRKLAAQIKALRSKDTEKSVRKGGLS